MVRFNYFLTKILTCHTIKISNDMGLKCLYGLVHVPTRSKEGIYHDSHLNYIQF